MTIVTTTTSSGPYTAVAQTTFAVTFQSAGDGEIEVTLAGVVQSPSLYTFTRGADGTGSVVFTAAVTGQVLIYSKPNFDQPTSFSRFGAFFPDQLNSPLDKAAAKILFMKNLLVPAASSSPASRANKFLQWDASGNPIASGTEAITVARDAAVVTVNATGAAVTASVTASGVAAATTATTQAGIATTQAGIATTKATSATSDATATHTDRLAVDAAIAGYGGVLTLPVASRSLMAALATSAAVVYLQEAGREGIFKWSSANLSAMVTADTTQGIYVAPASATTGASGAWVRMFPGIFSAKWFGAVGDNVTNDGAAVTAALAFMAATASTVIAEGGGRLYFPKTSTAYYLGTTTLDLLSGVIIEGDGGTDYSGGASILRWDAGVTGIRVQRSNTSGATGPAGTVHGRGDGSIIRNLILYSAGTTNGVGHGIHMRARAHVENVTIYNFQGNGIHVEASAGSIDIEGNVNNFSITNVTAQNCQHGLYVNGADANAGLVTKFSGNSNRRWGVWDSSFLGNTYTGCHVDANAVLNGKSVTSYLGNIYTVILFQEAGASTNAPSGTTANNAYWTWYGTGTPDSANGRRAWVSGMTWESGGAYAADDPNNRTIFVGCYSESGQAPAQFVGSSVMVLAGAHGAAIIGNRGEMYSAGTGVGGTGFTMFRGNLISGLGYYADNSDTGTVTFKGHSVNAPLGFRESFGLVGYKPEDLWTTHSNNVFVSLISGPNTTQQFGTGAAKPYVNWQPSIAIGSNATGGRVLDYGTVAPTTGAHAWGEIVFNLQPAASGFAGWICTAAGTPGTWKTFGAISA